MKLEERNFLQFYYEIQNMKFFKKCIFTGKLFENFLFSFNLNHGNISQVSISPITHPDHIWRQIVLEYTIFSCGFLSCPNPPTLSPSFHVYAWDLSLPCAALSRGVYHLVALLGTLCAFFCLEHKSHTPMKSQISTYGTKWVPMST